MGEDLCDYCIRAVNCILYYMYLRLSHQLYDIPTLSEGGGGLLNITEFNLELSLIHKIRDK